MFNGRLSTAFCVFLVTTGLMAASAMAQQTGSIEKGPSGLPLPRFVSLKSDNVNMRVGPGIQYATSWNYVRGNLPVEIIQEFDNWRRIRDAEGTIGWVHSSLLSGNRMVMAAPWDKNNEAGPGVTLYGETDTESKVIAQLKPGVIARVENCDGVWCKLRLKHKSIELSGYANQAELWGAYLDEVIK